MKTKFILLLTLQLAWLTSFSQVTNHNRVKINGSSELTPVEATTKISVIDPVTNEIKWIEVQDLPSSSGSSALEYQTETTIATTVFDGTQKGLNAVYPFNSASSQTIQIDAGDYVLNDVINIERRGQGSVEIIVGTGVNIRGVRDIDNRYFINDPNSLVSLICRGSDEFIIFGNLTRGYTGAITVSGYSQLIDGLGAQDITVIGSGFSSNMKDPVLTGNATLNSWTYINNSQITLNITETGVANDNITVTYDNGDIFQDVDAITITEDLGFDPNDLRHYYRLESDALDYKSTLNGTATNVTFSGFDADFNGTNSYIDVPDDITLSYGNGSSDEDMSLSFMVNFDVIQGDEWFVSKYNTNTDGEYRSSLTSTTNMKNQFRDPSLPATKTYDYDITSWTTSTWYHVIITKSSIDDYHLYINGSEVTISDVSTGGYVAMENTIGVLRIGAASYNNTIGLVDGKMKRVGLWNKVLSSSEANAVYVEEVTNNNNLQ